MKTKIKTISEINERINDGNANVITADQMINIVEELGLSGAVEEVDVVTTGTFGAMCSSGAWLNFGHSEPPIRMTEIFLNGVEAYGGVAAVDGFIGATQTSREHGIDYGGGHVIEDLVSGRNVVLEGKSPGTDCYPSKEIETEVNIKELNQAVMSNPRNGYERYTAAINSTDKSIYTYMGKILPNYGNITFSGAGELSPINNDPNFDVIGLGTKIFLGGGVGHVIGNGTQHSPQSGFATLNVQGDLKKMSPEFLRGATLTGYGCSLYVGIGIPIPILNTKIAKNTSITNDKIITSLVDYGIPSRNRPTLNENISYADLKSGFIEYNGDSIKTSPVSSFYKAKIIAEALKKEIVTGEFLLSEAVQKISTIGSNNPMVERKPSRKPLSVRKQKFTTKSTIEIDETRCVQCGLCLGYCNNNVFVRNEDWSISFNLENCTNCQRCKDICPQKAIYISKR